jgi:hypothetical protein
VSEQPDWTPKPARHYVWEPYQPGHELSMRHGAWSDRKVAPVAEALLQSVLDDPAVST